MWNTSATLFCGLLVPVNSPYFNTSDCNVPSFVVDNWCLLPSPVVSRQSTPCNGDRSPHIYSRLTYRRSKHRYLPVTNATTLFFCTSSFRGFCRRARTQSAFLIPNSAFDVDMT
ncbi:hypothetical protein BC826DRAFT_711335 [Russula brevipes]|nr:hypothetical protein BC826DRAFT_711335 [Russula brevipes]